jgi:integrase
MDMNEVDIKPSRIKRHFPPDESTHDDRPYTTGEIQRILSVCDLRNKAIVLLTASTGMRIGALPLLQIWDISKIEEFNLYKIQVYARTRDRYYTFTTPECSKAIDDYLAYRKRYKEELKEKAPLFRKHFSKADPFTINRPRFLSLRSLMNIIDEVLKRSGVKTGEVMRSHGFRKFFKSQTEYSAMKSINVELLMGHNIGVSGHYYRPTEMEVLQDYLKAVDALTIDPTQRLQKENQELKSEYSERLAILEEEIKRNRKATDHALAIAEAAKGAVSAKSEAAKFSLKL